MKQNRKSTGGVSAPRVDGRCPDPTAAGARCSEECRGRVGRRRVLVVQISHEGRTATLAGDKWDEARRGLADAEGKVSLDALLAADALAATAAARPRHAPRARRRGRARELVVGERLRLSPSNTRRRRGLRQVRYRRIGAGSPRRARRGVPIVRLLPIVRSEGDALERASRSRAAISSRSTAIAEARATGRAARRPAPTRARRRLA